MNTSNINMVLSLLEIEKRATSSRVIDNKRSNEDRYICIVELDDASKNVVKFYRNSYNTIEQVSGWSKLAKLYKDNGINVPLFRKFKSGDYGVLKKIDEKEFLIWVEDYIPEKDLTEIDKIKNMDDDFYKDLGTCLGKMHSISKNNNLKFAWNSPWVLFDTFCDEDNHDENYENVLNLYNKLKSIPIDKKRLEKIWSSYKNKRALIESKYNELASGAVQGDLSINNIIMNDEYKFDGILDFNIAGNDVFINHFMQESIFLSYLSDDFWNTNEEIDHMKSKWNNFFLGYSQNYEISNEEKDLMEVLYQIIRPFRMEKVYSTIALVSKEKYKEIDKRLEWMEFEMERKIKL